MKDISVNFLEGWFDASQQVADKTLENPELAENYRSDAAGLTQAESTEKHSGK